MMHPQSNLSIAFYSSLLSQTLILFSNPQLRLLSTLRALKSSRWHADARATLALSLPYVVPSGGFDLGSTELLRHRTVQLPSLDCPARAAGPAAPHAGSASPGGFVVIGAKPYQQEFLLNIRVY